MPPVTSPKASFFNYSWNAISGYFHDILAIRVSKAMGSLSLNSVDVLMPLTFHKFLIYLKNLRHFVKGII